MRKVHAHSLVKSQNFIQIYAHELSVFGVANLKRMRQIALIGTHRLNRSKASVKDRDLDRTVKIQHLDRAHFFTVFLTDPSR